MDSSQSKAENGKDLGAWLSYMEHCHSLAIDLSLERISSNPAFKQFTRFQCPVVTIAGTNGKGSCVAFLEQILLAAGYKVGAYTSPHLLHFNERIRVNGQVFSEEVLCAAFSEIDCLRAGKPLSFFEFSTLAALHLFQQANLDCVLLEVGLGGRLDAVNTVDSDIAVITSIAIDHREYLGDTREKIALEKAGIMRRGQPVVCGDPEPPNSLLQRAQELGADLYCLGRDFSYLPLSPSSALPQSQVSGIEANRTWEFLGQTTRFERLPPLRLPMQNAATSLMVAELLEKYFTLSASAIYAGLSSAFIPGRFQVLNSKAAATTVFDVAHNPAAAELLAQQLLALPTVQGRQIAVVGMLADKDILQTLKPLAKWIDSWYIGSLDMPRGAKATVLAKALEAQNIQAYRCFTSVEAAYSQALANANKQDRIVVFGSFHTVAAVMEYQKRS